MRFQGWDAYRDIQGMINMCGLAANVLEEQVVEELELHSGTIVEMSSLLVLWHCSNREIIKFPG